MAAQVVLVHLVEVRILAGLPFFLLKNGQSAKGCHFFVLKKWSIITRTAIFFVKKIKKSVRIVKNITVSLQLKKSLFL